MQFFPQIVLFPKHNRLFPKHFLLKSTLICQINILFRNLTLIFKSNFSFKNSSSHFQNISFWNPSLICQNNILFQYQSLIFKIQHSFQIHASIPSQTFYFQINSHFPKHFISKPTFIPSQAFCFQNQQSMFKATSHSQNNHFKTDFHFKSSVLISKPTVHVHGNISFPKQSFHFPIQLTFPGQASGTKSITCQLSSPRAIHNSKHNFPNHISY